jgi:hypothetical protein
MKELVSFGEVIFTNGHIVDEMKYKCIMVRDEFVGLATFSISKS